LTHPLPSNNFTDSKGDQWFCVESKSQDYHAPTYDYCRRIRDDKLVKRSRREIIAAKVKWGELELYKPIE